MTVTRDQAQMLASLAVDCRPYRAPTWDHAGVMAAIAEIRHMSLPEVILRVIRAAADRDAVTPGVIPKNGPHANEVIKAPKWEPEILPPAERCGICSHPIHADRCRLCVAIDDHVGEPDFKVRRGSAVGELRDIKAKATAAATLDQTDTQEDPMPPANICAQCAAGDHDACDGTAFADESDAVVTCGCAASEHEVAA